ncbi:MurR/RpiR family transcriptional regulator [Radicibacter daui]|uniref:MurR/RpiR family transcriptional regulator n=1 Tax=Radicibacter daui TaxID=3064829 RepID=UPI004046CFD7
MTTTHEPPASLTEIISRHAGRLTDLDTRLLNVLLQDPLRAAMENGKDVSSRAGVHPAAAVRLAQRLGFAGYPEFRAFLQASLVKGGSDFQDGSARIAARLMRASGEGVLSSILDSEIAALQQLRSAVSDENIRKFAETIRDGRRIFLFGRSHAATLSALVALRLRRSGYDAVDLGAALPQLSEQLVTLGPEDVLWLFAFRRPSPAVLELLQIARKRGARVLALTDIQGMRLDPAPDLLIAASRGGPGDSQSLVVPMTIANAVILDLAGIDDGRSIAALEAFRALRESLPPLMGS